MDRLIKLEDILIPILLNNDKTRQDDMYLYKQYLKHKIPNFNDTYLSIVFEDKDYRKKNKISNFDSVGRCRRKLQEKYEELRPTNKIKQMRKEQEQMFVEYAIER